MAAVLYVMIDDQTEADLMELSTRKGYSVTEILQRSVNVLKFFDDQILVGGKELELVDKRLNTITTCTMRR